MLPHLLAPQPTQKRHARRVLCRVGLGRLRDISRRRDIKRGRIHARRLAGERSGWKNGASDQPVEPGQTGVAIGHTAACQPPGAHLMQQPADAHARRQAAGKQVRARRGGRPPARVPPDAAAKRPNAPDRPPRAPPGRATHGRRGGPQAHQRAGGEGRHPRGLAAARVPRAGRRVWRRRCWTGVVLPPPVRRAPRSARRGAGWRRRAPVPGGPRRCRRGSSRSSTPSSRISARVSASRGPPGCGVVPTTPARRKVAPAPAARPQSP